MISKIVERLAKQLAYPTRHETKTTKSRSNTESALTTELDSDETKRLITRGNQGEICSTEQIWRESGELGLREDAIGVKLHEAGQLLRGELSIKVDDGSNGNKLD